MDRPAATAAAPCAAQPPRVAAGVRALQVEIGADRLLYGVIAAYLLIGWALAVAAGRPQFYKPLLYMADRLPAFGLALLLYVAVIELPAAIRAQPQQPLTALLARLRRHANPRFMAGVALFLAAGMFTGAFTSLKSLQNAVIPFWADAPLARLDAMAHFGADPWRLLQPILGHHAVTRLIQNLYLNGWVMALVGFTAAATFSARLAHLRQRFFLTYFATWILLGNVLAALFMSGGPVYFGDLTGDGARFADQVRYLSFSGGMNNSSVDLQLMLWRFYSQDQVHLGTGISAFPSLHVAMVTLFALTAFHIDRRLGWAMVAFAAVIQLGSVHLGWHYAIDGYASALAVIGLWFGIGWALRRTAKPTA